MVGSEVTLQYSIAQFIDDTIDTIYINENTTLPVTDLFSWFV